MISTSVADAGPVESSVSRGTVTMVPPQFGLGTNLAYGFGSIAFGIKDGGFATFLLLFYNQVLGLSPALVGAAIMVALVCDAFIDPLIGRISDKTHSRWGRRHPYMFAAAIPVAVTYFLLWNPPASLGQTALFWYLLVVAILVRVAVAIYEIPSASLAADLSTDYDRRTSFVAFRFFFALTGGIAMGIVVFTVFLRQSAGGVFSSAGYGHYGVVAAIVMFVVILASSFGTSRVIPFMAKAPPPRPFDFKQNFSEMRAALSNRSFLSLLFSGLTGALLTGLSSALNIYFATYFWHLNSNQIAVIVMMGFVSATLSLILAPIVSRRWEKKSSVIALSLVGVVLAPMAIILRLLGWFPATGSPFLLPALLIFVTIAPTLQIVAQIIGTSMMIDTIEDNEIKTGQRTEGLYFAAAFFTQKFVSGAGVLAAGVILSVVNFPRQLAPSAVNPATVTHLALVYLAVLVGLYLLSIYFVTGYRITRSGHLSNVEELAKRRLARPI